MSPLSMFIISIVMAIAAIRILAAEQRHSYDGPLVFSLAMWSLGCILMGVGKLLGW